MTDAQIYRAIADKLRAKFGYPIYANEVQEGFKRPSFFVQVIPVFNEYETAILEYRKVMVVISFFPKDGTDAEKVLMRDQLRTCFGPKLPIEDRVFIPRNMRADYEDKVLHYRFDLAFYDQPPQEVQEPVEIMQEIDIKWGDN